MCRHIHESIWGCFNICPYVLKTFFYEDTDSGARPRTLKQSVGRRQLGKSVMAGQGERPARQMVRTGSDQLGLDA